MHRRNILTVMILLAASAAGAGTPDVPEYYPDDYDRIIEASKQEDGILIYGNIAEYNWRYIIEGFQAKYPWIKKVQSLDLGPAVSFERYYAERSIGEHTADLLAVGSPEGFHRFARSGAMEPYASPETPHLPDWSYDGAGLYTLSTDPMVIIYNKLAMPESDWPDSLEDIRELARTQPDRYRDRVTTYDATKHSFAYDIHWNVAKRAGAGADALFRELGSITRPESGAATMAEKVTSGEYLAGYFVSGIGVFPRMSEPGRSKILGWSLIRDGTPTFLRGMALTRDGNNPNSAKLLLDYILSHEGQVAVGKGGLTPYRPDVSEEEIPYFSYQELIRELGKENIVLIDYDAKSSPGREAFLRRWKQAFRIAN
ncbi:MAG TPA: ABC transporter substrate-binding protein [Woeseiaceae bacterium]|nr:ABC transporter substrate-binding protein [Woeseiaceae bacterium]